MIYSYELLLYCTVYALQSTLKCSNKCPISEYILCAGSQLALKYNIYLNVRSRLIKQSNRNSVVMITMAVYLMGL